MFGQFPRLSNINERCFTIPFLEDNIVGNDRQLIARLDVDEDSFPPDVLTLRNPTVTVQLYLDGRGQLFIHWTNKKGIYKNS